VAEAGSLAILIDINKRSRTPTRGFGRLNRAISLLNRAGAISANYARNSVRTAIANTFALGLAF